MSVRAKAMFIVGWIVFIIAALLKMTHDTLKVHPLTEKFWLILMVTLLFAAFVSLAIVLILVRFGHPAGEIKNLHKFIAKAMEVEEARSKNRKYLATIESREYDLGYFLLAVIFSGIFFYGLSVILIIEKGHEFYEILLEGVFKGILVAVLPANLPLPLIHYATKSTLTDGRNIAFGIPAKLWIATGAFILLFGAISQKEFYLNCWDFYIPCRFNSPVIFEETD
uniref:Uncharacterized protein n=1 Tax=Archaeoglobus fulgidus TaxID=2234 RepID=A0A7C3RBZ3_ARCFL